MPACSTCVFFHQTPVVLPNKHALGYHEVNAFFCEKRGIGLYPVKAARKGLPEKYPEHFEGQIQMPAICSVYELSEVIKDAPF